MDMGTVSYLIAVVVSLLYTTSFHLTLKVSCIPTLIENCFNNLEGHTIQLCGSIHPDELTQSNYLQRLQ